MNVLIGLTSIIPQNIQLPLAPLWKETFVDIHTCSQCGVRMVPKSDGSCPSCGHSIHGSPDAAALQASPGGNPYESPTADRPPVINAVQGKTKEPFSHQAAKFSLYAPFVLILLNLITRGIVEENEGTGAGAQVSLALGALSFLTTLIAFAMGVIGFFGGMQRRAWWTVVCAVLGLLLSGAMITGWVFMILTVFRHH